MTPLRVPISGDVGVDIEAKRAAEGLIEVVIGWKAASALPRMSIVPRAGNVLSVEITLDDAPRGGPLEVFADAGAVADREFEIDAVQLKLESTRSAGVRILITANLKGSVAADGSVTAPALLVRPHAANLISVLVREVRGIVVG